MPKQLDKTVTKKFIMGAMKQFRVPGLAIAIVRDGKIILMEGFGFRHIKKKLPVTPETIFAIASCTKAFTTMAMALLVEEGKLDWDKPVREYLTEFKLFDPVATERMTPRDLVTHRSGLPRHDALWYKSKESRKQLFDRLAYLEPSKDFRSLYQYNNLMFMAAGCLIEKISGMAWEQFVQSKILSPLQMSRSNFSINDTQKVFDFALGYEIKRKKTRVAPFVNIDALGPAGSMNSCVSDLVKWLSLHMNQGKIGRKAFISPAQLIEMHSPQMIIKEPLASREVLYRSYGMGWMIRHYRGFNIIYHTGSMDGFSSYISFIKEESMGMVILTNMDSTSLPFVIAYSLYDRMLDLSKINWTARIKKDDAREKQETADKKKKMAKDRKKGTRTTFPLKVYAGEFDNPGYGTVTVKQKGKNLLFVYNGREFEATHYHFDTFLLKESSDDVGRITTYQINPQGKMNTLAISFDPTIKEIVFTRKN